MIYIEQLNQKDVLQVLEEWGWEPGKCESGNNDVSMVADDTPLFYNEQLMPLTETNPLLQVTVQNDMLSDLYIEPGDHLLLNIGSQPKEGDIVMVLAHQKPHLYVYCMDEKNKPWLVPQNKNYEARLLADDATFCIVGVVAELKKDRPRVPRSLCQQPISEARKKLLASPIQFALYRLPNFLKELAQLVQTSRQWYAVYRAMVDCGLLDKDDYETFCEHVRKAVPDHPHLPPRDSLQRMCMMCFKRPVASWTESAAPVKAKRYRDYLKLAQHTINYFTAFQN